MRLITPAKIAFTATILSLAVIAHAHEGAAGVVLVRMEAMKSIADSMKVIGRIAKGGKKIDQSEVRSAAAEISGHAAKVSELFPDTLESRKGAKTEAAPAIWERRDEFDEIAGLLAERAKNLSEQIGYDRAGLRKAVAALGETCKSCHETFRIER